MDDSLKLSKFRTIAKHDLPEGLSVDRPVSVQDGCSESTDDVSPRRFAWLDHFSCQFVGINDNGPALLEHLRYGAFPGGDTPGESDQDHRGGAYHASGLTTN